MNSMISKIFHFTLGLGLVVPAASYAEPVVPASEPLFLTGTVKHNVMLAIDDSGSMDSETLVNVNDGAFWLGDDGSFVSDDGSFNDLGEAGVLSQGDGGKYVYVLPNGQSGTYDGRRLSNSSNHQAIPPIKPFAFARTAEFNKSYYDRNVEYEPWPSYGGFTFPDIDPTSAPLDPMRDSQPDLDLTQNIVTSTKGADWDFDIKDSDMPCTDAGGACGSTADQDYSYFPAHYYYVDRSESSNYTFTPSDSAVFSSASTVLLEAEESKFRTGDYQSATEAGSSIADAGLMDTASGGDYIGVGNVTSATTAPPLASEGQLDLEFTPKTTDEHVIWVRKRMLDGSSDSLWVNLVDFEPDDVAVSLEPTENTWVSEGGQSWNQWWRGHTHSTAWVWQPWARVNFTRSDPQTLRFRYREGNVYIDQVLITPDEITEPSGPVELFDAIESSVTRNCATDPSPAHYRQFIAGTAQFEGVDAIGPGGECLTRVDIDDTTATYSYIDEDGNPATRTYAEEITNFANWFTYYRRRHQAMRGGLASAFQGIGGINTGLFWINNRRTVSMYDMDNDADVTSFLGEHYDHVSSGGTPNRQALHHAGGQYQRTGTGAPVQLECQKNFTMLFTDGFATTASISGIGNEDGGAGEPYADEYSSNLGDIAYKYYTENLRPGLPKEGVRTPAGCNETNPDPSLDCNTNLHMNTYTVGLGAEGTVFGVTHDTVADAYANPPTWPNTGQRDKAMIDDLYHAAVNGRGKMFNALTPADLRTELSSALRDIIQALGNASSVTFNTANLNSESLVFSALFNSTAWSGDLEARALDPATGDVSISPVWNAADTLDSQSPGNRTILTFSERTSDGVPFRWDTNVLDSGQVADLNRSPGGAADSLGEQRLNYIRGQRANEGTTFRNRSSVLGDIVHSTPVFVGKPNLTWPDSGEFGVEDNRYSRFKNITAAGRTPVIYVGANDGMLHGFNALEDTDAGAGQELLAYVPRLVYSSDEGAGLNYLTRTDYTHKYYVDMSPQAVDVYTKASTDGTADWRTVLIGGLRNGGVGMFALDVTDPLAFDEANADDLVLWEFGEDDDARLNYTLSQPTVGLMNNGRWAMIVGNGPANDTDQTTGVFIVYMDGGLDGTWTEGTGSEPNDYEYIEFSATSGGLSMTQPVDIDGDSVIDRIYGGDRQGNLWVLDVSSSNDGRWESAYRDGEGVNANALPLFTATDGSGTAQPITTRPLVVRNTLSPSGSEGANGEDYLVFFGTGSYLTQGDASDTDPQTFYGVWDRGDSQLTRTDLVEQTISEIDTGSELLRQSSDAVVDWDNVDGDGRDHGWRMDLPETGERVINRAQIRGDVVFFETFTPSQSPCDGGGSSWLMSVALDGQNPEEAVFDVNNDGVIDGNDLDDQGRSYIGQKKQGVGTGGSAFLDDLQYFNADIPEKREVNVGESGQRTGRLGWQDLLAP